MKPPLKPKVLGDVSFSKRDGTQWGPFDDISARVELGPNVRTVRIPFTKTAKWAIPALAAIFFAFGSVSAPTTLFTLAAGQDTTGSGTTVATGAATSTDPTTERTALESQLAQLETQIDQYQGQIASYKSQGNTLSSQINQLNAKVASLNLQIQATNLTIEQLDEQINDTQSEITATQSDITSKQAAIADLVKNLYQSDQTSLIEVFLENPQLSDFWDETQNFMLLQDNLRLCRPADHDLQGQLQGQEQQFEASKSDASTAAAYAAGAGAGGREHEIAKSQLLAATQGQESKYQTLLTQTQASAAQIRNQIFQLLGGGQLTFGQAYQYAQLASQATGIDPAFILAILDRESALGQNVGQCNYQTAMSPSQQPTFLAITKALGLDPNEMMVSCPNADGVYGGAMGPAQFEPSTWELYASGVSKVTGNNPASPWNDSDAFVATALYLKDAMTGCKATYSATIDQERCTAAKYYAGGDWKNYLWTYGEAVVEQAQSFDSDIQTLTQAASS